MFSKACEYSIKATIFIATQSMEDKRTSLKEIAAAINSPEAYTAKLLQQISRHGIIQSVKGAHGGFEIPKKDIGKIRLCEIVDAIDGDSIYTQCGLGMKACSERNPCPVHDKFKQIKKDLKDMLEKTNLKDLCQGVTDKKTRLKL